MLQYLEKVLQPYLKEPAFLEVLDLVKKNSKGKIWLIGGYLYRNLNAALHGGEVYDYDIDFIVEERSEILEKIPGWNIEINRYGVSNYVRTENRTSFTDINKAIRVTGLKNPTIDEFIQGTPLTIQSIGYDLSRNKIIGEIGVEALRNKIIKVNDINQAEFYAKKKVKSLKDIIIEKAKEIGFNYELP